MRDAQSLIATTFGACVGPGAESVSGDLLAVIALAFRSCTEPLCYWEVRLDDGTVYRNEQGPEASFEIPRQGFYFDLAAASHALRSELGRYPDATEYSYCLPAGERVAAPEIVPPPPAPEVIPPEEIPPEVIPPEEIPPEEIALEEIATGGSSALPVVVTDTPLHADDGALYLAAVASKPYTAVTNVSGLGLVWTPVGSQCGGRRQTEVSVWQARGEPTEDGIVTATLSSVPAETLIAASRYSASAVVGSVVSGNTRGAAGACDGGTDADAYALELDTTEADSLVQVWVAMRSREHFPGPGFAERLEAHQGSRAGDQAGLALAESAVLTPTRVDVSGSFSSIVDWAVVAVEIRRPAFE